MAGKFLLCFCWIPPSSNLFGKISPLPLRQVQFFKVFEQLVFFINFILENRSLIHRLKFLQLGLDLLILAPFLSSGAVVDTEGRTGENFSSLSEGKM